ncbi:MAG: type II secretion system protein GspK [Gammaproteobacteria bacterium]
MLQKPDPDHPWPVEGSPREWTFGSGKVRISVVDAAGRIDLNHAAPELLKGLLTSAGGLEDAAAQALVDKIADFRDPDDAKQINGAEKADYQAAGRAPKDSDFESVEELQQVLDMTPEIYERIAPALTMASGQPGIDPAAASALVLNAIPGSDPQMVEEYIAQRTEAIANQSPLPPPPAQLGAYLAAAQGLAYHVAVEAELETGTALAVRATVTQPRLPKQLYYTIDWRED